jgi:hypothetical protein
MHTKISINTLKKVILTCGLLFSPLSAQVDTSKSLEEVIIQGDDGGYYNTGDAWNSSMLKGKTTMLMYVDPDEKNKGEVFKPTIESFEKDLDFNKFQIVVIINLKATWKPNALIESLMKSKLTDYPKRIYVLDKDSVLVKKWGLTNDEYNTLVINKQAKVIYSHSGEWKKDEISKINSLIRSEVK